MVIKRFHVVSLMLVGLLLIGSYERLQEPDGSELLINARDFLGVDEETFEQRLKDQFIVKDLSGDGYYLEGQDIYIRYEMFDLWDLPSSEGKIAEAQKRFFGEKATTAEDKKVAIIDLMFPYTVSKATAIKMLGYPSGLPGNYSEDGLWRDRNSGHTITVTPFEVDEIKTRIRVSITSELPNN